MMLATTAERIETTAERTQAIDARAIDYKNIPVQADVISGILGLDVESDTCFRELEAYVCSDLGVAALVLRVVNSVFYSHGSKITNISKAISVLGFNVMRSLAMLAFSRSLFGQSRNPLFKKHIWQHSLLTAIAAQTIYAELGGGPDGDEAFIAGLLHDVGKVLMFNHAQERYLLVLSLVVDKGCASIAAERQIFGCDHVEVGGEAVAQWKLPPRFRDFMAVALGVPSAELQRDRVCLSLAAANRVVADSGIGARRVAEGADRTAALTAFGCEPALCARWTDDAFAAQLADNEAYRLCAEL